MSQPAKAIDEAFMRQALRLAARARGLSSPNPMVGALVVRNGKTLGRGWHHCAGEPHAEIEALHDAEARGFHAKAATLYVTLEPCSTWGRTPPCTDAIIQAGIRRVVVGATDPNPAHAGTGLILLRRAGVRITGGILAESAAALNEDFNHWIVHRTPFVTVKAAMSLDGRIAVPMGESKWITGAQSRARGMDFRLEADAILVGVNTVLADDPALTYRGVEPESEGHRKRLRRIILDSRGRIPLDSRVVSDSHADLTTVVVTPLAPASRVARLERQVRVLRAPARGRRVDLRWLLRRLGSEEVIHLLVEGGGAVNASFLLQGLAHRVAFFYAPKILGGADAPKGVGGRGVARLSQGLRLRQVQWFKLGSDLLMTARLGAPSRIQSAA